MKIIALMTDEFRLYYGLIKELKRRNVSFISLAEGEPIPYNVGVVITTLTLYEEIDFPRKITVKTENDIPKVVDRALEILRGRTRIKYLIIGVDPGKSPGVAVMGDGELINQYKCYSPEEVSVIIEKVFSTYDAEKKKVKVGHQAVTIRNRIINDLLELGKNFSFILEIADETSTTHTKHNPDINAAIEISSMPGSPVDRPLDVNPTPGELRDIQRISRINSGSQVTISRTLAARVAIGDLDLNEAIALQKKTGNEPEGE